MLPKKEKKTSMKRASIKKMSRSPKYPVAVREEMTCENEKHNNMTWKRPKTWRQEATRPLNSPHEHHH